MTKKFSALLAAGLSMVMSAAVVVPAAAQSDRQKNKNNMRNLGIVLGAGAAHQAIKGKTTNALVLGAGAALSAKKYEDARKAQSKENNRISRVYRYRNGKRIGYYKVKNGKRLGYVRLASR